MRNFPETDIDRLILCSTICVPVLRGTTFICTRIGVDWLYINADF